MKMNYLKFSANVALGFLLVTGQTTTSSAQKTKQRCSTVEHEQQLIQKDSKYTVKRQAYLQKLNESFLHNSLNRNTQQTYTIPVVVHVVYKNAAENISDAQIESQIDVLNEDFNFLNADTTSIPQVFKSVAGNAGVTFCLAKVDPNGNGTNGIERRSVTSTPSNDNVKSYATGGLDAWDVSQYFNMWVSDLGNGLFGYAEFPSASLSNTYGVSINYTAFGRIGNNLDPYSDKGRTASHEVGHCFNLNHIWGNSQCGDDLVADTPPAESSNFDCPPFPHNANNSCGAGPNGEMFMNYMDYTSDACLTMFTDGQVTRMLSVLTSPPYNSLTTSNVCIPANIVAIDAGVTAINIPSLPSCGVSSITPQIEIKNFGSDTLFSTTVYYQLDGGTPSTYNWTGSLKTYQKNTITLPTLAIGSGNHVLKAYTAMPNGTTDGNTVNDTLITTFVNGSTTLLPLVEGFESANFPYNNWSIENLDNATKWEQDTYAYMGNYAMHMNNYDYDKKGEKDIVVSPTIDLTGITNPQLSFYLAYQMYLNDNNQNETDTLEVLLSTDCGTTWNSIYKKFENALATASPASSQTSFHPTSSNDWRKETIDLSSYNTATKAIIKFVNINMYANDMYIDNVNIDSATVTTIERKNNLTRSIIFPNPTKGQLTIAGLKENSSITVSDILGRQILKTNTLSTTQLVDLSSYNKGVYLITITNGSSTSTSKIVLE